MFFFREEYTNLLPGAKLRALRDNAILYRLRKLYLGMYYTYLHAVRTNEKEAMRVGKNMQKDLERRKERESVVIIFFYF